MNFIKRGDSLPILHVVKTSEELDEKRKEFSLPQDEEIKTELETDQEKKVEE